LSTIKDKEALTTDRFMGLVSSLRSGDEREKARQGQARPGVQGMG